MIKSRLDKNRTLCDLNQCTVFIGLKLRQLAMTDKLESDKFHSNRNVPKNQRFVLSLKNVFDK